MHSFLPAFFLLFSCVHAFVHPGLLVNNADIARIKTKLSAKRDPWQASWDKLTSIKYSQSDYTPTAVAVVSRNTVNGATANADLLWHDAAAAFTLALRWKIEGNTSYAEAASKILGAWGRTLKTFAGADDQYLVSGLQGHQLVNAAELLRDYAPFQSSGNAGAFTTMFQNVFVPASIFFLNHQAPSQHNIKHFHANWELCNIASVMAFGVYTENATLYNFAVDYFKTGTGNGGINNAISNLVTEPGSGVTLGQPQEAGRDQGHTGLDFQLFGVIAQQAWNQGDDLYGYNNSRILQGAEYFARYNLGNDVPFVPWTNNIVSFTVISPASRGAIRPAWELLYAHYAQIKGLDAPWTTLYRNHTTSSYGGFEQGAGSFGEGSGHYDGLGWGSLLYRMDADDVASAAGRPAANVSRTSTSTLSTLRLPSSTGGSPSAPSMLNSSTPSSSVTETAKSFANPTLPYQTAQSYTLPTTTLAKASSVTTHFPGPSPSAVVSHHTSYRLHHQHTHTMSRKVSPWTATSYAEAAKQTTTTFIAYGKAKYNGACAA